MDIVDLLDWAISHGGGITEARAEDITRESLSMEKGRVKSVSSSECIGFGVRVLLDGCIGYACTTRLSKDSVKNAVECAIHLARASKPTENPLSREERTPIQAKAELRVMRDHGKATLEDKLSLLRRTHESAMEHGKDIKQ
jgi:Predicted Zn-dependent proteases and their inactivated homologs